MSEWFEEEEFWASYAPVMFDAERWAETEAVVEKIIALTKINPNSQVLDLCCGPGRHSVEFARLGYTVCGVDITESYLEAAKESARDENVEVRFVKADVRTFCEREQYDLALNLYTSFGYFDKAEDDALMVHNAYASLKKGGIFIIDTLGKEIAARDFCEGESFERSGGKVSTKYKVLGAWESLQHTWIFEKDGKVLNHSHNLRLYSAVEMKELLLKEGFTHVDVYGSFEGKDYDEKAISLIAVATK